MLGKRFDRIAWFSQLLYELPHYAERGPDILGYHAPDSEFLHLGDDSHRFPGVLTDNLLGLLDESSCQYDI